MKKVHGFMVALGLGLVIYLIRNIGIRQLWNELTVLGWGLVPLIVAEGVAELFHAIGWRCCLNAPPRSITLIRLFHMNMAGYAISYITPTASLGGDATKAGLLALNDNGLDAVTSVLINKLSFALAHLLFVVLGLILILPRITLPRALRVPVLAGSIMVAFGIVIFLWIQKHGKVGVFTRWLVARSIGGKTLRNLAHQLNEVDDALKNFYRQRPWGLPLSVFWHSLGYAVGIFQIWCFLHLLVSKFGITIAGHVWFVGMWFDLLAFAVPTNVGVLEGGRMMAFKAAGYEPLLGMTYAIALRATQLFWTAFGLASYVSLISTKAARIKGCSQRSVPAPVSN